MAELGFKPKYFGSRSCHLSHSVRNSELFLSLGNQNEGTRSGWQVLFFKLEPEREVRWSDGRQEDVQEGELPEPGKKDLGALALKSGKPVLFHPLVRGREGVITRRKIGLEGSIRNKKCSKSYRADHGL